jgi:hypothetical protein
MPSLRHETALQPLVSEHCMVIPNSKGFLDFRPMSTNNKVAGERRLVRPPITSDPHLEKRTDMCDIG